MAGIRKKTWKNKKGQTKFSYEITYYIDGKQYRKSGYKTKQDAQNDLAAVTKTITSTITFKQLVEEYISNRYHRLVSQYLR